MRQGFSGGSDLSSNAGHVAHVGHSPSVGLGKKSTWNKLYGILELGIRAGGLSFSAMWTYFPKERDLPMPQY